MSSTAAGARTGHAAQPGLSFWRRYVFSTDHKTIGKQYLGIGLAMALIGGFTAYLIRWQLAWPETEVPLWGAFGPDFYNMLITMHGTIMIFFVAMPILLGAFGNFLIPLMIGADDMAFPRLNMMSVWTFFVAAIILVVSFFVPGGAAAAGWTSYPPLSAAPIYTGVGLGIDLWILAVAIEFASFLMGGVNFLTTVISLRAPGMSLFRLPMIVWTEIVAAVLFMLSVGPLVAGALMLLADRTIGTAFFLPERGGDPLLWQHLFWFFGHPEVYVVALPGFGAMLEIMPVFSRKPIFGYKVMVYSMLAAGVLSFIVWAHHMFVSGMDPRLATPFSITTILISVPFAIMVFSMVEMLWRGSISFPTPMLFALGALACFILGGVTGIFVGSAALNIYLHGTNFVVAHFHYTLFPTAILGGFAALYYWYPKMFGRMMNEGLGQIHFWGTFIFFNLVFIPMFLQGLAGEPRRLYEITGNEFLQPLQPIHVLMTIGAIGLLLFQLPLVVNFFWSLVRGKKAVANPWQANTLEWATASPPPHGNFSTPPVVYRGPYEFSQPGIESDWMAQDQPDKVALAAG